jgi:3-methyladenine DNA glycosylase AlkD
MTTRKPSVDEIARQAVTSLRAMADPVRAAGAQRYFKDAIVAYGATAPQVHDLVARLFISVKGSWTADDAIALCDRLVADRVFEPKAVGILLLGRFKNDFPRSLFPRVKRWLVRGDLDNWASVDTLCADSLGALLEKYPALVDRIKTWSYHPNRWVKRASAVSFIKLARDPRYREAVYGIALSLFPVKDDLVEKANGWLLREAGKGDARRLEAFLLEHGPAIPRTTLRYAVERFPEGRRKSLLATTRRSPSRRAAKPF